MYLSNTSLSKFIQCPAYGFYKYILNIRKKKEFSGNSNSNTAFGQIIHHAFEVYGREKDLEKAIKSIYDNPLSQSLSHSSKKNILTADVLVRKGVMMTKGMDIIEVEKPFKFQLGENYWIGRWDAIVKDNGLIYVMEYKTTGSNEFQIRPNSQVISYYVGAREYFENVGGVYVYVMQADNQEIKNFFVRPTPNEIQEWKEETIWLMKQVTNYINLNIYPKNERACHQYNRECEYLPLCKSFGKVRENLMNSMYEKFERRNLDEVE